MAIRSATRALQAAVLILLVAGCAAGGREGSAADRNIITAAELERFQNASAFEVVQRLRPHFLQRRGPSTYARPDNFPVVYVDNQRRGELGELRHIPAGSIERIEFVSAADATTRWGTGHVSGVIAVHTRR